MPPKTGQRRIQDIPLGGGDLRHACFLVKTNVKTKELDHVGEGHALAAPPGSANADPSLPTGNPGSAPA